MRARVRLRPSVHHPQGFEGCLREGNSAADQHAARLPAAPLTVFAHPKTPPPFRRSVDFSYRSCLQGLVQPALAAGSEARAPEVENPSHARAPRVLSCCA